MPIGAIAGAAAPIVGGLLGKAVGGGGPKNAQPAMPKDLGGLRQGNIGLLQYLLGFNQPGMSPQQQPQGMPQQGGGSIPGTPGAGQYPWGGSNGWGAMPGAQGGGAPGGPQGLSMAYGQGGMSGGGFNPQQMGGGKSQMPGMVNFGGGSGQGMSAMGGPAAGSPGAGMLGRMESYFGPLGTPTTPLQQQSLGGISQFLNSNPYGQSNSALQGILGGNGGFGQSNGMYGQAAQGFKDVGNANYFGGAQGGFQDVQKANLFGGAKDVFNGVSGYNPFGAAQHSLEGMLGANPGQGMLDALRPQFEQNLAAANQEGGRFGSANAIMRSHAMNDYNLLGAQALQHGIDQQIAAAGQYGVLGNNLINARLGAGQGLLGVGQGQLQQGLGAANGMLGVGQGRLQQGLGSAQGLSGVAGGMGQNAASLLQGRLGAASQLGQNANSMFGNMAGAYGIGSQQANQEAQRQQQALQILLGQLGVSQQATFGAPTVVSPTGAQQGAQIGAGLAPFLGQIGGGIHGAPAINPADLAGQVAAAPNWADLLGGATFAGRGNRTQGMG